MNAFPQNESQDEPPDGADPKPGAEISSEISHPEIPPEISAGTGISLGTDISHEVSQLEIPRDPPWNAFDLLRLAILFVVALIVGIVSAIAAAHYWIYPHASFGHLLGVPLVVVAGQALAYVLVLAYMYVMVTREYGRQDFLAAVHWNWPSSPALYVAIGGTLSIALQVLASRLPIPKHLPIDSFFRTPAEAWALTIFGVTLAPLMEEMLFRAFLYPVVARSIGVMGGIVVTGFCFALLHSSQLANSWGPVLVIFLVGITITAVRAYKDSVAAGLIIHIAYNGTISALMFAATDGFRHLEKLQ